MYEEEILTLNKAARYAGVKTDEFIKMLGCTGLKAQKPIIGTGHRIILYSSYIAEHQVLDEIVQQRRYLIGTEVYLMIGITGIYT